MIIRNKFKTSTEQLDKQVLSQENPVNLFDNIFIGIANTLWFLLNPRANLALFSFLKAAISCQTVIHFDVIIDKFSMSV